MIIAGYSLQGGAVGGGCSGLGCSGLGQYYIVSQYITSYKALHSVSTAPPFAECRTPSPPTKSFSTKSPRVKLSGRLPIQLYGSDNSHPLKLRVCLSQTLWNPNSQQADWAKHKLNTTTIQGRNRKQPSRKRTSRKRPSRKRPNTKHGRNLPWSGLAETRSRQPSRKSERERERERDTIVYYNIVQYSIAYCNMIQHTILYYTMLYYSIP